jgi:hypothetical protein
MTAETSNARGLVAKWQECSCGFSDPMGGYESCPECGAALAAEGVQAVEVEQRVGTDEAMHWIDRYAAGIDSECQIDRIIDAVAADAARDVERYHWLRKALLGAEDDPIDHLLLEKEPETEAEFDSAVDAAIAALTGERNG